MLLIDDTLNQKLKLWSRVDKFQSGLFAQKWLEVN